MGRAIVRDPAVFLFDEPLSNLDAKLRVQMRAEIKSLHQKVRTTAIYVTHDQIEAMTLADRIAVMNAGRIEQLGTPLELYRSPVNRFVAGFIGSPAMNFLAGRRRRRAGAAGPGRTWCWRWPGPLVPRRGARGSRWGFVPSISGRRSRALPERWRRWSPRDRRPTCSSTSPAGSW